MLTIRNLDDALKRRLRIRAAEHGLSMEEEARRILRDALVSAPSDRKGLGSRIHQTILERSGGGDLELPPRSVPRSSPFADRIGECFSSTPTYSPSG
jgi:plasmid stability protein